MTKAAQNIKVLPSPQWVGTGRGISRSVSPSPPLSPYVRLSPHTAAPWEDFWHFAFHQHQPRFLDLRALRGVVGVVATLPASHGVALRHVHGFPALGLLWPR
jgi:hypothetical protein